MYLLDVNVLVAGFRTDHPRHHSTREWLAQLWDGDQPFTVPSGVLASFLRIVTNRRIFEVPAPRDEAFSFLEDVRALPGHLALEPGPRHLILLRTLCDEADAAGDLMPDAVLAALAVEHGCVVITMDRDFARFTSVSHRLLLSGRAARTSLPLGYAQGII